MKPCSRYNKIGLREKHERNAEIATHKQAEVILFGDSIIAGLYRYSDVWDKSFRPLNTLNFGIGGDQTQHVQWRIENMTLPHTAKYIVVHCGTNNTDTNSPFEIAKGVISCGLAVKKKYPQIKVVITGILPRDLLNSKRRTNYNK